MNPARLCAVRSLVSIAKSGRYANLELDAALKKNALSSRDSALFTALVYGVIEREITLDFYISLFCKRKSQALSPFLRATLQSALYQLEFMQTIPTRAVLFEAAEIAKLSERQTGANLVSAVLRAFLRARESGTDLTEGLSPLERRSVRFSIPVWMLKIWDRAYGREKCDSIAAAFLSPSPTILHINLLKTTPGELLALLQKNDSKITPHPQHSELLLFSGAHGNLQKLPGFEEGLFFAQDYSSACAIDSLAPEAGMQMADVCAAPGGKSFAAAIRMKNCGKILASDLHQNRLSLIDSGAERLGINIIHTEARDARNPYPEFSQTIDRVLCDVPCSGLGVLSKKPDLRHKTLQEITTLPKIQRDILESASTLVRPGGRIVYSTCTLNPSENEEVVSDFLTAHPDFQPVAPMTTLFPDEGIWDGFFYAAMEKQAK